MPETRKYDPGAGDPIHEAIRAALGEQVRPTQPGPRATPGAASQESPTERPKPATTTLGAFTFTSVPKPRPAAAENADEDAEA